MKRLFNILAVLALSVMFSACDDENKLNGDDGDQVNVVPNFPEMVEDYAVEPGSTLELVFTPNLAWKVSVPSEIRQWFWIKDGSFSVTELTGSASAEPVSVYIGVTENADFDKNYSCDVTLEMGNSSKVIAKYMLPAKEKTLEVYAAKTGEDGSFILSEDGAYVYSNEQADALNLVWSVADAEFKAPFKVVSNCDWAVELPEWAELNVPENMPEIVELVITGESLEGATGKMVFVSGETSVLTIDVSVPSCKGIEVYTATLDEGEFVYGDGGEYVWSEKPVSAVSVEWMGADFRMPVRIESKFNWTLELPEWLTVDLPEKTAGDVMLTLMGVPSKYPLDDASGTIVFKKDGKSQYELPVTISGCKDIMTFTLEMSLTTLDFNNRSQFYVSTGFLDGPVSATLTGVNSVRIVSVETTGGVVGSENPSWLKCTLSNWNTASGADVIQERTMSISAEENIVDGFDGEDRSAVLFVLPPSITAKTAEMFTEKAEVKEEYAEWAVAVTQKKYPYVFVNEVADAEFAYSFEEASREKSIELTSKFGATDDVYVLTYESPYCRDDASMTFTDSFDSYKVYDSMFADMSDNADFWLKFTSVEDSDYGIADMYLEMDQPYEPSVGYIVFYDAEGIVLAIVECVSPFVPKPDPVLDVDQQIMIFTPENLEKTFSITSNVAWNIECQDEWCAVNPTSGEGDAVVSVSLDAADSPRETVIRISSETISREITVKQKVNDVLELDVTSLEFGFFAAEKTVTLTSNVAWNVVSSEDWCSVSPSEGEGEKTLTVSVSKNASTTARTAEITISSEQKAITLQVTQRGNDGSQTTDLEDEYGNVFDVDNSYLTSAVEGVTVYECKSGPYYEQYDEYGCPILILEYSSVDVAAEIQLPSKVQWWYVYETSYSDCVSVNDGTIYDTAGKMEKSTDKVTVKMTRKIYDLRAEIEGKGGLKVAFHKTMYTGDITLVVFCRLSLQE